MRNNLAGLVEYFTCGDLADMKNLSYFLRTGSLAKILPFEGEISVSVMNTSPYRHLNPPVEVNFNGRTHAFNLQVLIQIKLVIASLKTKITHAHKIHGICCSYRNCNKLKKKEYFR